MRISEIKILVVAALAILCSAPLQAAERTWTRSEILAVTDQEAERLGYSVEQMSVSFDSSNSKWHDYLESATNFVPLPEVQATLRGREYLAVYYSPLHRPTDVQSGGDLWAFLDWTTGDIIEVVRGQ